MPKSIRAFTENSGKNIGTGFFVRRNGESWLITAAHIHDGTNRRSSDWRVWPDKITLQDEKRGTLDIPLFLTVNGARVPTFRHYPPVNNVISDIIALKVPVVPDGFTVFDLNDVAPVCISMKVHATGYPSKGNNWLRGVEYRLNAKIIDFDDTIILFRPACSPGASGGPIVKDGKLAGMHFGHDRGVGKAVTTNAICQLLDSHAP